MFKDKKELALQLRASHDRSYPLHWDFSAAGGVKENEDHKSAAIRELKEELGIVSDVEFVGEELYRDKDGSEMLYIYKTDFNGSLLPDPEEVDKVEFFTLEKISEMIEAGSKFHPEFLYLWNKGVVGAQIF